MDDADFYLITITMLIIGFIFLCSAWLSYQELITLLGG